MQYEDLDDDMKIELQKKFEENRKIILSMNPEEFLDNRLPDGDVDILDEDRLAKRRLHRFEQAQLLDAAAELARAVELDLILLQLLMCLQQQFN